MDRVIAFYARVFPETDREIIDCMWQLVTHPSAEKVSLELEAVPFNRFGFGLFPPGRSDDPTSPCLTLWFDDPSPLYWVQLRRWAGGDILTCDQAFGSDDAWAAAAKARSRLNTEAERMPARNDDTESFVKILRQLSPITNFADEPDASAPVRAGGTKPWWLLW